MMTDAITEEEWKHIEVCIYGRNYSKNGKKSIVTYFNVLIISFFNFPIGVNRFSHPSAIGDVPSPRSGSCLVHDSAGSRLLVFGGWSEHWTNDLYSLPIDDIVGTYEREIFYHQFQFFLFSIPNNFSIPHWYGYDLYIIYYSFNTYAKTCYF